MKTPWLLFAVILFTVFSSTVRADMNPPAPAQSAQLTAEEAEVIHQTNLMRRANALPPLRWNKQLSEATRWFAWDSVENRPASPIYCGHIDTQGNGSTARARAAGYKGFAGVENAICGYRAPAQAITDWMNSPAHKANILDASQREIGVGYYYRASDQHGYIAQLFGSDPAYAPVIINDEAISTTTTAVSLYIYDRQPTATFYGMGPATQMMVSNDANFVGASWEAYGANKNWALSGGTGWRTVYVKTRDALSRTLTVSDTIYLGANVPLNELGAAQMSSVQDQVTLNGLNGGQFPLVQFSAGWLIDDGNSASKIQMGAGAGATINDPTAWGGTALRIQSGIAWAYTTDFYQNAPLVAYFRLKTASNASVNEVARLTISGGATFGPISLKGTDFSAANQYQEFALPFTFSYNAADPFLKLQVTRTGAVDIDVDAITIFSAPQAVAPSLTWNVPGGHYRGQGVWVRYTHGSNQFSSFAAASSGATTMSVTTASITMMAAQSGPTPSPQTVVVTLGSQDTGFTVSDDATWLTPVINGNTVQIAVNPTNLSVGTHTALLTLTSTGSNPTTIHVPVTLVVASQLRSVYLPLVVR